MLVAPVVAVLLALARRSRPSAAAIGGLLSLVPVDHRHLRAASRWGAGVNKELQSAEVGGSGAARRTGVAAQQAVG